HLFSGLVSTEFCRQIISVCALSALKSHNLKPRQQQTNYDCSFLLLFALVFKKLSIYTKLQCMFLLNSGLSSGFFCGRYFEMFHEHASEVNKLGKMKSSNSA